MELQREDDNLKLTVECKTEDVNEDAFEHITNSIFNNLSAQLGIAGMPEMFNAISEMRAEYMENVLKYMVEVARANDMDVPDEAMEAIGAKGSKCTWDPEEEDE